MQCVVLFLAEENITAATTKVYGTVAGIKVPFQIDNPNACEDQGITCPMIAGKDYTFKTVLPIKSIYPSVCILEILASSQQTTLVPKSSSAISVRARFNLVPRALFWSALGTRLRSIPSILCCSIAWGRGCKCLAEPHISNINSTKGPICRTSSIFPNFIAATHLCEQNALHCTFLGVKLDEAY